MSALKRGLATRKSCLLLWGTAVGIFLITSAAQAVTVSGPFVDTTTRGDWRNVYGQCFVLLAEAEETTREEPVGPDSQRDNRGLQLRMFSGAAPESTSTQYGNAG